MNRVRHVVAFVLGSISAGAQAGMFDNAPKLISPSDPTQAGVYHFQPHLQPAPINVEPFTITPTVGLSMGRDNNVKLSQTNRLASNFLGLAPSVAVALPGPTQNYALQYSGNYVRYKSSSEDNYNDHNLGFDAQNEWTSRAQTRVRADYIKGHDPAGSTSSAQSVPDKWHLGAVRGAFLYGAEGAQGQIEVDGGIGERRYDNNRTTTVGRDRDQSDVGAAFYYRVMPATQVFVQARHSKFDYTNNDPLDSKEKRYMVGGRWQATAATQGSIKAGRITKEFDNGAVPKFSGTGWEGSMTFAPITYSQFDVSLFKGPGETSGVGDYIITRQESASWRHDWSDRIRTTLNFVNGKDEFRGTTRVDDRRIWSAQLSYGMQRWLRLGAEFQHQIRDSNDDTNDYRRNLVLFTVEGSL